MIVLRKGKKVIKQYDEPFAVADDVETLAALFQAGRVEQVQRFIRQNAFSFALYGSRARLGGGVMLETARA